MIARRAVAGPGDGPTRGLWLALMFVRHLAEWRAIGEHDTALDAARHCVREFWPGWLQIAEQARTLRALAEHPAVAEFSGDGVDGPMLKVAARRLAESIESQGDSVARLLDEPAIDDVVRVHGAAYQVDPATGALALAPTTDGDTAPDRADALFIARIHQALADVRAATGHGVTRQGFDDALIMLLLMHPDDDAPDATVEQDIADRLYGRIMAATLHRVYQRTGELVSARGLEHAALFAAKVRDAIASQSGIVRDAIEHDSTPVVVRPDATAGDHARVIPFPGHEDDDLDHDPAHDPDDGGEPDA